jgi:hypothetical protein
MGVIGRTLIWAIVLSLTGFALGFFAPMIFELGPQGPLLGIIFTGPIAFVAGGFLVAFITVIKLSGRHNLYGLIICTLAVAAVTLLLVAKS